MKTFRFFLTLTALFLGIASTVWAQDPRQPSNYVVIGAFANLENAVKFTDAANQDNFQAQYAIQTDRKLYYVFILNTEVRKKAFAFLIKIRSETKHVDAWMYMGRLGEATATLPENKPTSIVEKHIETEVPHPVVEELPTKDSAISEIIIPIDSLMIKKKMEEVVEIKPAGKPFYFKLVDSQSDKEVMGEIRIGDSKTAQHQAFKGNEMFYLMPPKNNTGVYQASILALGYRGANLTFDYKDPSAVATGVGEKQETIIAFELARIKKGDYIDFNTVRFFTNSDILEPSSQGELDELAAIMKNDQAYKVKIHGHCNGTESREIVTRGTSTNFFATDAAQNKKETATPKKLTEYRAEAIKSYLVSQGIDQARISIKGEGGKMMIHPPTSTLANYNDRVEVEVLKASK